MTSRLVSPEVPALLATATGRILRALWSAAPLSLTKADITRATNLSYVHVHRVLPDLVADGLVDLKKLQNGRVEVSLTRKGRSVITALAGTTPTTSSSVGLVQRTRIEVLVSILEAADDAEGGVPKTHIMYRANLSHRQVEKYLTLLEKHHLIREVVDPDIGRRVYEVTEKGFDFLKEFERVTEYFSEKSTSK